MAANRRLLYDTHWHKRVKPVVPNFLQFALETKNKNGTLDLVGFRANSETHASATGTFSLSFRASGSVTDVP